MDITKELPTLKELTEQLQKNNKLIYDGLSHQLPAGFEYGAGGI